jgi:hypothetical protein
MKANEPALIEEKDIESWQHLVARLDVTLMLVGGAEAQRIFRALGPQRRAHALQHLLLERQRLILEMQGMGVCALLLEGSPPPASGFPCEGALDTCYELLAQAYARCVPLAERMERLALRRWLLDRTHMHRQHALFFLT